MPRPCTLLLILLPSAAIVADEPALKMSEEEAALFELVNAERKASKLPPLKANAKLFESARSHAANMAKLDKQEQELDGKDVGGRAKAVGYKYASIVGPDTMGPTTPKECLAHLLADSTRNRHLHTKDFKDIGIGVAKNAKGVRYWYLVLAEPAE